MSAKPPRRKVVVSVGKPDAGAAALYRQGQAAQQRGDLGAAEAAYLRVIAAQPDHCNALHMLGILEAQRGLLLTLIPLLPLAGALTLWCGAWCRRRSPGRSIALLAAGLSLLALVAAVVVLGTGEAPRTLTGGRWLTLRSGTAGAIGHVPREISRGMARRQRPTTSRSFLVPIIFSSLPIRRR